jgi:KDO2-lipid IV(A) lauroyltransferase
MQNLLARSFLLFLRLLQHLPLAVQAAIGVGAGKLLWILAAPRRRVALRNLELCLPELPAAERKAIAKKNFEWIARSFWSGAAVVRAARAPALADARGGRRRLRRAPPRSRRHVLARTSSGSTSRAPRRSFSSRARSCSVYQRQSKAVVDAAILAGRTRFGNGKIFSRHEKAFPLIKAIQRGWAFFNLPDMDFGPGEAVFVPFVGVPAATLTAPSKMARKLDMVVQPVLAEMLPGGAGYRIRYLEPWTDFPTDDPVADARRMNAWIESEVRRDPSQYFWVHKRFKTRPPGEPSVY